jgi:purine-binding chemotaxis protein CheW
METQNTVASQSTESQRFLCFRLGDEDYAVPLLSVKEVIAMPDTTPIPNTPSHFMGIMNLRGQVISIIDLRVKFGFKSEKTAENCVIICDFGGLSLGVVVSAVENVHAVSPKDIGPRPDLQGSKTSDYVTGVIKRDKNLILLVNLSKALGVEEQKAIAQALSAQTKVA